MFFVLANLIVFVLMGMEYEKQKGKEERKKSKSKFVGVRQRASGKWAAEIKDKSKKIRMWLGTYKTAEEAARAYDEAACLLRGSNTRTNFSTTYPTIPTNSPISLKLRNLLDRSTKATSNQSQSQSENQSTPIFQDDIASLNSTTIQKNFMVMEDKPACSSEGNKSLFWVQNQACDNLYGIDMNMMNCSMGLAPNLLQFDYSWLLPQQGMINHLSTLEDSMNVGRQLSGSVYDMNECCVENKYEYDVNYPLSHLF